MKNSPTHVVPPLVSILKKLDAAQPLLTGDGNDWIESKALDRADGLMLEARSRLASIIAQLDPQAIKERHAAERGQMTSAPEPVDQGSPQTQPTEQQVNTKFWLIRYATTITNDDSNTFYHHGVIEAADLLEAENKALRRHAFEGFPDDGPQNSEEGEWMLFEGGIVDGTQGEMGFLAFKLSDHHNMVDAGNLLWIDHVAEIDETDFRALQRHLNSEPHEARRAEQLRLRGLKLADFRRDYFEAEEED